MRLKTSSKTSRNECSTPGAKSALGLVAVCFLSFHAVRNSAKLSAAISETLLASDSDDAPQSSSSIGGTFPSLEELTQNPPLGSLDCPNMTSAIYDRVVDQSTNPNKIPKILHISFKSRCVGTDIFADGIQRWKDELPDYSVYYHDDDAVDRLLQLDWPEFPQLHTAMKCMKYGGAMKSDLWRMLIIYKFGGLYTDIDNAPAQEFQNGTVILPEDTFFASSDGSNRPCQNVFAMEAGHPIAFFTIKMILQNVLDLPKLARPKLVFTTGPNVFWHGYDKYMKVSKLDQGPKPGIYKGFLNKQIQKEPYWNWKHPRGDEKILWNGTKIARKERDRALSKVQHWSLHAQPLDPVLGEMSCGEYLYRLGHSSEDDLHVANRSSTS